MKPCFRSFICCLLSGAALACLMVNTPAEASPTPSPAASPSANPCSHGDTIGADEAFAREIDDARTLAFLSFAENIAQKDRAAVANRAARLPKETTETIDAALGNACDATEVDYRTTRLEYMLATRWSDDEAIDDADAERDALAALLLGDRVPASIRDATLAVFGTTIEQLDAMIAQAEIAPTPGPSSSPGVFACIGIDAKTTRAISPTYPPIARQMRVTGAVQVKVSLDAHGYVRAVTLYSSKFAPSGANGDDLVTASITSAGSSNYTPQFVNCKPLAGSYIFRAQYIAR